MKIVSYSKWIWTKIDIWFKLYAANLILFLMGILSNHPYDVIFLSLFLINLIIFIGALVKEMFDESYSLFEKEQNKFLETLKNSDKK